MTVTDQQIIQAFQQKPVGEVKAYVVVFKETSGDYFQKYFYAKTLKEAKIVGREYVARFESKAIVKTAVIARAV